MSALAVSVKTAAEMVGASESVIRAAINRGDLRARRLPPVRRGAQPTIMRIDVEDLRAWLDTWEDAR